MTVLMLLLTGALLLTSWRATRGYAFGAWVLVCAAAGLIWPEALLSVGGFQLTGLIVPLIQLIMFGMGTTLSVADFARAIQQPLPVLTGVFLQFLIMPLLGAGLALSFGLDAGLAAGIVLIGSCSGGVASNVMAYIAGGNVALSVTMTACSTLVSPLLTPLLMQLLAGTFVPIDTPAMMISILNLVITPILAGLFANQLLYGTKNRNGSPMNLLDHVMRFGWIGFILWIIPSEVWGAVASLKSGLIAGCGLLMLVAILRMRLGDFSIVHRAKIERGFSLISMLAICIIIAIIAAKTRDTVLSAGLVIFAIAVLHNTSGYLLGYWLARLLRLNERDCRTVAFEVGMQNGGMATGLALTVLKDPAAAVGPAMFSPVMNVTGSWLAGYWKSHPAGPIDGSSAVVASTVSADQRITRDSDA